MKYRIISDIHTEFWNENFDKARRLIDRLLPVLTDDSNTTLLLAGDIGSHKRRNVYAVVIEHLCKRFMRVIDIPGNHFWYGGSSFDECVPPIELENYFFAEEINFASEGIIAATLWTDFNKGNPDDIEVIRRGMNDYCQINDISPQKVYDRHIEHVSFLRFSLRDIFMTHHAPSYKSIADRFKNHPLNPAYASDLEDLILQLKPKLWVHGHVHEAKDYMIGETRIICNPVGYFGENTKYNPELVVEV